MDEHVLPGIQKWIRKCIKKEFGSIIENRIERDEKCSTITETIIRSEEMSGLLNSMKIAITEEYAIMNPSVLTPESRPQSSFSFGSEFMIDDWNPSRSTNDFYNYVIDKISCDKPVHVRLAGYEALLNSELTTASNNPSWDILQKTLIDGLADESRAVFEASLQVHSKLLNCPQSHNIYSNMLNAFNTQFHSERLCETLPTLITGINFKFYLHEKLFRIMDLIIRHQEEILKCVRTIDKNVEDIIEQFIIFLSTHTFGTSTQPQTLSILNIISILQPQADWSKRWIHSLATRKTFITTLAKSPNLLQKIIECVNGALEDPPTFLTISISEDPIEVCITGEAIKTLTYLHCLTFVSELCAYEMGRTLLSELPLDTSFTVSSFPIALLTSLNKLSSSEVPNGVYSVSCKLLISLLEKQTFPWDMEFYSIALRQLISRIENDIRIWPHTLYTILHMLDTADGVELFVTPHMEQKKDFQQVTICPATVLMQYSSNLMKQPFSMISIEYVIEVFKMMEKLLQIHNTYEIIKIAIQNQFYPAVSHFYTKYDKYFLENRNKAQHLDSAIKKLLLNVVAIPSGLYALAQVPVAFEELIRGSIAPLRTSWLSTDIASFVSLAAHFTLGYDVLVEFAPHVLSTLLAEVCDVLEDPEIFNDPWNDEIIKKFLHIITLFSLNFRCFVAFMTNTNEDANNKERPKNLYELIITSVDADSPYHYLGLLSLQVTLWNLNIHLHLLKLLNFQEKLLHFQEQCIQETQNEEPLNRQYIIDHCSLLRHKILMDSYYIKYKYTESVILPEECQLFSTLPPPKNFHAVLDSSECTSPSELECFLKESKPGFHDSNWVSQIKRAHSDSRGPIKNSLIINLLDQMHKAIPTSEWNDQFTWENASCVSTYWCPEDIHGVNLVLQYAEENKIMQNSEETRKNLEQFLRDAYTFINYNPSTFQGFDWFLSTVFILCEGDMHKCKTFISQLIQFPSSIYLWPAWGIITDKNLNEECNTQFVLGQLLESIISDELPHIKYALKNAYGVSWWTVCNAMIFQCFWGTLPWHEIIHFICICILYSPDYLLYYCVSLLYHCKSLILENIANKQMWPESMVLEDYRCHDYIPYMDTLGKRYSNKVLSVLIVRKDESITGT